MPSLWPRPTLQLVLDCATEKLDTALELIYPQQLGKPAGLADA